MTPVRLRRSGGGIRAHSSPYVAGIAAPDRRRNHATPTAPLGARRPERDVADRNGGGGRHRHCERRTGSPRALDQRGWPARLGCDQMHGGKPVSHHCELDSQRHLVLERDDIDACRLIAGALTTGATPKLSGVYYDDSYDRTMFTPP